MSDKSDLANRVKQLEKQKAEVKYTVIFNDYVYLDGKRLTLDEYKATNPKPPDQVINLTWGEK